MSYLTFEEFAKERGLSCDTFADLIEASSEWSDYLKECDEE